MQLWLSHAPMLWLKYFNVREWAFDAKAELYRFLTLFSGTEICKFGSSLVGALHEFGMSNNQRNLKLTVQARGDSGELWWNSRCLELSRNWKPKPDWSDREIRASCWKPDPSFASRLSSSIVSASDRGSRLPRWPGRVWKRPENKRLK